MVVTDDVKQTMQLVFCGADVSLDTLYNTKGLFIHEPG